MRNKPIWTLEGQVLDVLGEHNLSLSDRSVVHKICQDFAEEFVEKKLDTRRDGPDFQEAGGILKVLERMGYKLPDDYRANQEDVLYHIVKDIGMCAPGKDADLARRGFLNRQNGRLSLERDGD
jgi:hypothetical protein